jgi:hypothetical protein
MTPEVRVPRAIEAGFPIVEINRLAVPERNSFKPIYQNDPHLSTEEEPLCRSWEPGFGTRS